MKIEVLVTTMYQDDMSKYNEMNLQIDAVIANQTNENGFLEEEINGKKVRLVSTDTRGLSKNRNIALENIDNDTDIIVFADDDLKFYDGYEQKIISAFSDKPEAQAIKFNINCISERKISMNPITQFHKASRKEVTSWGVCGLAIEVSALREKLLTFNERFGTGTENYCGEDTIFLQDLFKKKIPLYASPDYIAEIDQSHSTWFKGYDEKYFTVAGMIISEIYPVLCYLLVIRSAYKFSKRKNCNLPFLKILKCYYKGIVKNARERKIS